MESIRDAALGILKKTYGYDSFRGNQGEIIERVAAGGNAFVLMPTGGGKSLCYQIPSLLRPGVGVIVSPLIALMQDQVDALTQLGVRAAAINSNMDSGHVAQTKRAIREGKLDLLYVAPERLLMDDFLEFLAGSQIALFAIDEAHCVSQWGHDFRPHYVQLSQLAEKFPKIPRIALTATADGPTRKDIVDRLGLKEEETFVAGFDRPNIHYQIDLKKDAKQQLLRFIQGWHWKDSGVVYCLSRKMVDETAEWLSKQGLRALPYHAGMAADARAENQARFLREENMIMVATIAFGMGIDKPDVRYVVHMTIPKNIEAYYQETGRAGRDGLPANALMLYSLADSTQLRRFIDGSESSDAQKRIEHRKLDALIGLCEAAMCRRKILLEYFGDAGCACGNCDNCLNPPETFDATVAAQKALSCCYRTGQRFGALYLIEVLRGNADERMQRAGHDKISTFGIGPEFSRQEWQNVFRQLVALNYLSVDGEGFGVLKITPEGHRFLKAKETLKLRHIPKPVNAERPRRKRVWAAKGSDDYDPFRARLLEIGDDEPATEGRSYDRGNPSRDSSTDRKQKRDKAPVASRGPLSSDDEALFAALKAERLALAREQDIAPFIIFHDRVLREIAAQKPTTLSAFSQINGVGQAKLERYGEIFVEAIRTHLRN